MAQQYTSTDGGLSVCFLCGPDGQQLVEFTMHGIEQYRMTLSEYLDLFIQATSEANRRRALERKKDRRKPERRVR